MTVYVVTATTRLDYEHGELVDSPDAAREDFIEWMRSQGANPNMFEIEVEVETPPEEPYRYSTGDPRD